MLRRIIGVTLIAIPVGVFVFLMVAVCVMLPPVRYTMLAVAVAYGMVCLGSYLIDNPKNAG